MSRGLHVETISIIRARTRRIDSGRLRFLKRTQRRDSGRKSHRLGGSGSEDDTYFEKIPRRAVTEDAVFDFGLRGQIFWRADWRGHFLHDQIRGEVGHVRRDQYHREKPPDSSDDTSRRGSKHENPQLLAKHQRVCVCMVVLDECGCGCGSFNHRRFFSFR